MSGALSAREAGKRETREALLRAAMDEFAEKGRDLPSLDASCARAGFTRGAFYVHFATAKARRRGDGASVRAVDAVIGRGRHDLAATVERSSPAAGDRGRAAGAGRRGRVPRVRFHDLGVPAHS
jgi:AcrR family transcriptional regulator